MSSKIMIPSLDAVARHEHFLTRLAQLYENMDAAYNRLAAEYGFSCAGCQENCCRTRFYNHTWLEFYYLARGLAEQPPAERRRIENRAADSCREVAAAEAGGQTPRVMCPLNDEGWCGLHAHRLMICRLHGIPYEFSPPGRQRVYGEGCAVFSQRHGDQPYRPFDRSPFYMELSALEHGFRQAAGIEEKIKLTIAEMILQARPGDAA